MYRSGALKFSNGATDSNVVAGLSLLSELTGNNQCSSHQTLGDHVRAGSLGWGCSGAHFTAFSCGNGAQNSCCSWSKETTYSGVKQKLFDCLQSMWDEGIHPGQKGHWETMRSTSYTYASCGFAWDQDGKMNMNQDFYRAEIKQPCSCEGKQPGESDGCGGSCAGCSEPVVESCRDKEDLSWGSCEDAARWNWCEQHSWISEDCPLTCGACPVIEPTCPGGGPSATPTSSPTPAPTPG